MTTELDRISRLPKATLARMVLAFAQDVPAPEPVDADVAPTPEPEAPAKEAKAKGEVTCAIKAHKAGTKKATCNRLFWSAKGANEHVAKLGKGDKFTA